MTTYELDGLGRTIAAGLDPDTAEDGVSSYTVYIDYERQDGDAWILNETRSYPAWDPVTNHPTGPTIIRREIIWNDPASTDVARYSESLSISAAPGVTSSRPHGAESFVMADIQSLSREYYNLGGQVTHGDVYHSRQNLTYSTAIDIGAAGVNRYRTTYSFNRRGWLKRTQGPDGTIQRNEYDNLGRTLSTWVGTDDTPDEGRWSPDNNVGANMLQVSGSVYNFDGQLTQSTSFGSATAEYVTDYGYDWRGRMVASRSPDGMVTVRELDNLGRAYRTKTYADVQSRPHAGAWIETACSCI